MSNECQYCDLDYWRNEGFILCPYCNFKLKEYWDYGFEYVDGYDTEIDCPECDNTICVTINLELKFTSSKKEIEER